MFILDTRQRNRGGGIGCASEARGEELRGSSHFRFERVRRIYNDDACRRKALWLGSLACTDIDIDAHSGGDPKCAQLAARGIGIRLRFDGEPQEISPGRKAPMRACE